MSVQKCCIQGFAWSGTPSGQTSKLANNDVYITGNNPQTAILFITDLFGWTFPNIRLLADHFAREVDATVYVPDFFNGEVLDFDLIAAEKFAELNLGAFIARNSREIREPEIFECARALKQDLGFKKVGAVGYCYGGWASFRLGAKEHADQPLVDCISVGHPSLLERKDVDEVNVPVQLLAPEIDMAFPMDFKMYALEKLLNLNLPFDYQHFPGVVHGCLVRGDEKKAGERAAMERGKDAAVAWFTRWLKDE
ncbi:dienelactone hydrolase family protein [Penicillium longicatenatum]|uniref:dienelactone hydrolase family protein n=1 Tax=Penicillium longicatenatum TaxID=1561947 RepID=UPI002546DEDA|nr:dienelactone hydrolase family protein [Penicillium longicatenatum]KAJ5658175.1 dienelactone hydrolase family protein [Penicillium longicatenatum]